jgi:hypothetical protein
MEAREIIGKQLNGRVEDLLRGAEQFFGPRVRSYQTGVFFLDVGPMLHVQGDLALIVLSEDAWQYPDQALHQLAHEVVHLLSPLPGEPLACMLEEGAAVWFSIFGPAFRSGYRDLAAGYIQRDPSSANYRDALALYEELIGLHPRAVQTIRERQPSFHELNAADLVATIPGVTPAFADRLLERRQMRDRITIAPKPSA